MHSALRRTLLLRGAALWILARIAAMATIASAKAAGYEIGDSLVPLWALTASLSLLLVDLHRRKEFSLLFNLGISTNQAVLVGTLPAVCLEALLLMLG